MELIPVLAQEGGSALLEQELAWVALLSIAAFVAIFVRRIRLPYTVALVLVGLALTFVPSFGDIPVSSDFILALLVPPLLFEATLHVKWSRLRSDLGPILLLAVVGSLVGAFIVAAAVSQLPGITWPAAFIFGALISATDPVAVIAFFRSLGVSKRLAILVEGESMFNDGVAVVLFSLAVSIASATGAAEFSLIDSLLTFVRVAFGGIAVGLVLGYIVSTIILARVDDHLIETTTTVALAFGSYVVAEEFGVIIGIPDLHFSGILAVVVAGIFVGNIGTQNTSPTTRVALDNFWELVAFVVNSIVFLVIGLEINITEFEAQIVPVLVAVAAVLLSRAIVVYSLAWLNNQVNPRRSIPRIYQHVMYWGGLRGAISLALALTLTASFAVPTEAIGAPAVVSPALARELQVMTFGVVLFTLLFQGTTIERLIRRLGLAEKPAQRVEQQRRQAMLYANRAGKRELDRLHRDGIVSDNIYKAMAAVYESNIDEAQLSLRDHLQRFPELERSMVVQARRDTLQAERSAISDAARRGLISEEVYDELIRETDDHAAALDLAVGRQNLGETPVAAAHPDHLLADTHSMDCIVVAVRGGEASRMVKQRAVALAQQTGARILFLYVVDEESVNKDFDDKLRPAIRAELRWVGEALLRIAQQRAERAGVRADIVIVEGQVREQIGRFLQVKKPDVLLLGAPRGTTRNVFGDDAVEQFALAIEDQTGVPVEVVRPEGLLMEGSG